ncbi:GNAT family N-acetyltransferase [Sporolactobacillus sp. KGMB 08714]|uniref:GNAT family N-acetyltransferase n=1 Tax=Sporolactobacillus sp. KGMB 08714 TaxID=3064704 RepID=UPI002FBE288F
MLVYENTEKGLTAFSLDKDRWDDFTALFGRNGACGGCWCMSWRLKKADFEAGKGESNKAAMRRLAEQHAPLGVLMYLGAAPIGWCAAAPRENYLRLKYSRVFKRIDQEPVWSVSCLFLAKANRRKGLAVELIRAAVSFCKLNGATCIEAYPAVPYSREVPAAFLWTGIPSSFETAGFKETVRRSKWKRMMRYTVE